ncbi:hypothetical protein GCM10009646_74180 [Streptomyces aureus]
MVLALDVGTGAFLSGRKGKAAAYPAVTAGGVARPGLFRPVRGSLSGCRRAIPVLS